MNTLYLKRENSSFSIVFRYNIFSVCLVMYRLGIFGWALISRYERWGGEGWNLWTSDNLSDGVMFNNVSSDAVLQKTSRTSQARVTWTNWIMGMLDFLIWHVDTKPISVQKCEVYSGKFSLQNCQGICSTVLPLNAYYRMLDMIIITARHFDSTQAEGRLLW